MYPVRREAKCADPQCVHSFAHTKSCKEGSRRLGGEFYINSQQHIKRNISSISTARITVFFGIHIDLDDQQNEGDFYPLLISYHHLNIVWPSLASHHPTNRSSLLFRTLVPLRCRYLHCRVQLDICNRLWYDFSHMCNACPLWVSTHKIGTMQMRAVPLCSNAPFWLLIWSCGTSTVVWQWLVCNFLLCASAPSKENTSEILEVFLGDWIGAGCDTSTFPQWKATLLSGL